jgi:hypothetical protein
MDEIIENIPTESAPVENASVESAPQILIKEPSK